MLFLSCAPCAFCSPFFTSPLSLLAQLLEDLPGAVVLNDLGTRTVVSVKGNSSCKSWSPWFQQIFRRQEALSPYTYCCRTAMLVIPVRVFTVCAMLSRKCPLPVSPGLITQRLSNVIGVTMGRGNALCRDHHEPVCALGNTGVD